MTNRVSKGSLFPYCLWILLFVIAPIALIVYYSLLDLEGKFTLSNYQSFFSPAYIKMTFTSFWYAFLITFYTRNFLSNCLPINKNKAQAFMVNVNYYSFMD